MNAEREFKGKDLEEALQSASVSLGIAEPELDYEILEQGRRGLFGFGARSVRIRVKPPIRSLPDELPGAVAQKEVAAPRDRGPARRPGKTPARRTERKPERRTDKRPEKRREKNKRRKSVGPAESAAVQNTVQRMFDLMGFELNAQARAAESGVALDLEGPDGNLLTQKDGELISALQFLLNRMGRRAWPGVGRIRLSCDGDRQERDEDLVELTREVAQQVNSTGKPKRLHPMNAYERRLVHITVREHTGLGSRSEGNGYLKRVRIFKQKS